MGKKIISFAEIEKAAENLTYNGDGPEEPDTQPILGDIIETIQRTLIKYIDFSHPSLATVASLWIVQAFCFESFQYCGYLALRSPTLRCGKSRLLKLIALFIGAIITAIPTAATIFRSNRKELILDEVDMLGNRDKETFGLVLAVLNCGFEKGATIPRCEKEKGKFEIKEYDVFGPKALAGIESLADTLADRCFQIPMQRTSKRLPRLNLRRLKPMADDLQHQIRLWFAQKTDEIEALYEGLPDELHQLKKFDDRFQDISEPLVVLAGVADTERGEGSHLLHDLITGLTLCAGRRQPTGKESSIIAFLGLIDRELGVQDEKFMNTSDIVGCCLEHEDLAWVENGRRLANLLRPFDLFATPGPTGQKRGYWIKRDWVEQWKATYPQPTGDET
jgi:hypothetical protein